MSNLLNANLPSDDEEDQDYVPDEVDEEERRAAKLSKKPKRLRGAAAGADAAVEDGSEGAGQAGSEPEDEHEQLPDSKREAKKAKVDALWSQLNRAKPAAKPAPNKGGTSLASLCKPAGSKGKSSADEAWMRQLGLASKPKAAPMAGQTGVDKKTSVAAAALAAAKAAASVAGASRVGTVTVTEQRRFAGQTITVNKEVAKDSKEAQRAEAEAEAAAEKKKAGLDAVLASLQQAKKVTVLDKSRADWKDFKKADDTIDEELEMHKRSGDQYLDKQAFLQQADLREYEKERDRRLASDVRNRGRL